MHSFDLEDRTYRFARDVSRFLRKLKRDFVNIEYSKQALRAASSVGANYIEANEPLGKKDFLFRIKICRKEIKEFIYWLRLIKESNVDLVFDDYEELLIEATELKKIFSSIIERHSSSQQSD